MVRQARNGKRWHATLCAVLVVVAFVLMAEPCWAQSARSTIHGTVRDESGAAMPGVTVTLSSPALQVGQIVVVSEVDGTYRVGELPAGLYRINFELAGFKAFVLADFRLTIGFVARVDAMMAVGGLEETVTVTGASPVVDMTSTTTSVNLTQETLESVPIGRGLQQLFAMTPGVTTNRVDVGDSWMGVRANTESYGQTANSKIQIDGIDIADGTSTGVYMTSLTLEEAQIRTSGNDAEVSVPGVSMVAVIKSGSNHFHGSYIASLERPELQSSNLNDALRAQGLSDTEPLRHLYDLSADLGGRLVRDKLWFYGAIVQQDKLAGVVGFASGPGPDGKYLTEDDTLADVRTRRDTRRAQDFVSTDTRQPADRSLATDIEVPAAGSSARAQSLPPAGVDARLQKSELDVQRRAPEHAQQQNGLQCGGGLRRLPGRLCAVALELLGAGSERQSAASGS
jgi:hypothetical protein